MTTTSAVYAWSPDGEVRRLSPPAGFYTEPVVHPDGSRAVFWGGAFGTLGVWQVDLPGGRIARLTAMASDSWRPSYSVHGERMVHTSDRFTETRADDMAIVAGRLLIARRGEGDGSYFDADLRSHIFVNALDGRGVTPVTTGDVRDDEPALSPDGARIVFVSDRGDGPALWIVATEAGPSPEPLLHGAVSRPRWSTDGERVYFQPRSGGVSWVAASGGPSRAVTLDGPSALGSFSVDPAGGHLLAHAGDAGAETIWELPLDGGAARELRPPGFDNALHPSRGRDGVIVFASIVDL